MSDASDNLRNCQRQLDMDGCEVGVSRQALDETLDDYDRLLMIEDQAKLLIDEIRRSGTHAGWKNLAHVIREDEPQVE